MEKDKGRAPGTLFRYNLGTSSSLTLKGFNSKRFVNYLREFFDSLTLRNPLWVWDLWVSCVTWKTRTHNMSSIFKLGSVFQLTNISRLFSLQSSRFLTSFISITMSRDVSHDIAAKAFVLHLGKGKYFWASQIGNNSKDFFVFLPLLINLYFLLWLGI